MIEIVLTIVPLILLYRLVKWEGRTAKLLIYKAMKLYRNLEETKNG